VRGFYRPFFSFERGMIGTNEFLVRWKAGRTLQGGGFYEL
jgi:hypothetical protein